MKKILTKNKLQLFIITIFSFKSILIHSQNPCDATFQSLKDGGLFEYTKSEVSEKSFKSMINYYRYNRYEHYEEAKKAGLSLGIFLDDILGSVGLNSDEQSYRTFIENIETYYSSYASHTSSAKVSIKKVNEQVVNLLNNCYRNLQGVVAFPVYTDDPNTVKIRFHFGGNYRNAPKIASITVAGKTDNMKVLDKRKVIAVKDGSDESVLIKKIDNKNGDITFTTDALSPYGLDFSFPTPSDVILVGTLTYKFKRDDIKTILSPLMTVWKDEFRNEGCHDCTKPPAFIREGWQYPRFTGGQLFTEYFEKVPNDKDGHVQRHMFKTLEGQANQRYQNVIINVINTENDPKRLGHEKHWVEYLDENGNPSQGSGYQAVIHFTLWSKYIGYTLSYERGIYDYATVDAPPQQKRFNNKKEVYITTSSKANNLKFSVYLDGQYYEIDIENYIANPPRVIDRFGVRKEEDNGDTKNYVVFIKK